MNEKKQEPKKAEKHYMICSWCGKRMYEIHGYTSDSHGICNECRDRVFKEKGK